VDADVERRGAAVDRRFRRIQVERLQRMPRDRLLRRIRHRPEHCGVLGLP
jgi:hypothetical protein